MVLHRSTDATLVKDLTDEIRQLCQIGAVKIDFAKPSDVIPSDTLVEETRDDERVVLCVEEFLN